MTVAPPNTISATTGAHAAGLVNVVVTNPDSQSGTLTNGYTYTAPPPAPTVTGISPTSGTTAGGTPVTITGTNFQTGATVSLGGTAATGVTVTPPNTINATTGAHAAGLVNVVVTNPDSQSGTLTNGYTLHGASSRSDDHELLAHQRGCRGERDDQRDELHGRDRGQVQRHFG